MTAKTSRSDRAATTQDAAKQTPTPRDGSSREPTSDPAKPVIDSAEESAPVVAQQQGPEHKPQRRKGGLSEVEGVRVIHTTTRDIRRNEREARQAEERRLAQAGTGGVRRDRAQAQNDPQPSTANVTNKPKEIRSKPANKRGASKAIRRSANHDAGTVEEARPQSRTEPHRRQRKRESAPRVAPGDVVEGVRGTGGRIAEYVRTHTRFVITVCAIAVLFVSVYPAVRDYYIAWRQQEALQAQYSALSADHDNLESDVDRLQSREGVEDEARRNGYGYSDENTLNVEGVDDDPNQGSSALESNDGVTEDVPWYVHVGDVFFLYFGG